MQRIVAPFSVIREAIRTWWDDGVNLLVLNLAWVACQVTVVFGPPATLSIFQLTRQLVDGEAPNLKEFVAFTKEYFVKGWLWMVANILVIIIVWSNLFFYGQFDATWAYYARLLFILLALLWLPVQFYALSFLVIQETKSLRLAWKNAILTLFASPGFSAVIILFGLIVLVLSVLTMLPLFFGVGMLLPTLSNHAVKERLDSYRELLEESEADEPDDDEPAE